MIVDSALYRAGQRVDVADHSPGDLRALRACAGEGDFVWVGLHEPTGPELEEVRAVFGLHELAVEDALHAHQRPKLERYDDSLFLVLKTLWYVDEDDAVETGEVNLFLGADFVVTVRHGHGGSLSRSRRDLERHQQVLAHGPAAVFYAVCDQVVDEYEAVGAALEEDVDEVEASVFSPERTDDAARIYTLKRELAEVRRAVLPLREPMRRLAGGEVSGVAGETAPYFRDVADHLQRVAEVVDSLDALLSTAFDAYVARVQVQQNDDMRRISASVGLIAAPTLVGSVYGMNFEQMPELGWRFGYPFALAVMALSSLVVWLVARRAGWL
ncbi:magnesium/cobalt transporter CorA [Nocardioides perillae]|uniref:Magnesium transport protein CorA n=1 Tax=Nocardioides perillae TaxID=1119534 RepID=A0A7Y9RV02_9ACTN|nr:magnesium transporter [Nocardioides perillae]